MDKKIIYTKFNKSRKKEFKIQTAIYQDSKGNMMVCKKGDKESKNTIQALLDTYKNINNISKEFIVLPINQVDDYTVEFPFIDGTTLHEKASLAVTKEGFDLVILEYIGLLDSIPTVTCTLSQDFQNVFGEINIDKEYVCLKKGVLDFNLGNLIVDNKKDIHFFDYEWTYNFPIPKEFVLFRSLLVFYMNTNLQISYTLGELFEKYIKNKKLIKQYYRWEGHFQEKTVSRGKNHQTYTLPTIDINISDIKKENYSLKEQQERIRDENKKLKEENEQIMQEVEEFRVFKKGRIWKTLLEYRNIKERIKRNAYK